MGTHVSIAKDWECTEQTLTWKLLPLAQSDQTVKTQEFFLDMFIKLHFCRVNSYAY